MTEQKFDTKWIIENTGPILSEYHEGITLRQLYYRLVSIGMTNNINHYRKVIYAMTKARWEGIVDMDDFVDRERSMALNTEAEEKTLEDEIRSAKEMIKVYMESHHLERWSNQDNFVEVWIEKKALQGVFEYPCGQHRVGLAPCKGYPSLTFLNNARKRFDDMEEQGKKIIILYFGDHDPSGEDIPRSIQANLERMGCEIEIKRIALNQDLIDELQLPGVPPKATDSRTSNWGGGEVVELDAVEPNKLKQICSNAIAKYFDKDKFEELKEREEKETEQYQEELKDFVNDLAEDDEE